MNKTGHKSISVIFTSLIIMTLVLMGPASAVNSNISDIDNAIQGADVEFQVKIKLESPDMNLPIAYTTLIFTNPDETTFECKVYNDGTTNCDNIDVVATFDYSYNEGPQLGYGYGYDQGYGYGYDYTYFGYGYGYGYQGEDGQITYDVTLHLANDAQTGEYTVMAETYAITEDSNDDNQGFGYSDTMLGMYREYFLLAAEGSSHIDLVFEDEELVVTKVPGLNHNSLMPYYVHYDPIIDLNEDGRINLIDVSLLASEHSDDAELFGRLIEFFRYSVNEEINPELDLNNDGEINLADISIFAENYGDEEWCANQISLIPGVERVYVSNAQTFDVANRPTSGTPHRRRTLVCGDGYENIDNICVLKEVENEDEQENPLSTTEDGSSSAFDGLLGAITGAVVGAGEKVGLSSTASFLLAMLVSLLAIVGVAAKAKEL